MSRKYDARTTLFSPEGRLFQVEYAIESIKRAGTCVGIRTATGIVLAAQKEEREELAEKGKERGKLEEINPNIVCGLAGVTSDANLLLHYAREAAEAYLFTYNENISVELLVKRICDMCQVSTQKGGLRPYGVSFLIAGHDPHYGFQLYHTDPSGNYSGWKAHAIGSGNAGAESILKDEYKDEITLAEAKALAVSILDKSMDATTLTKDRMEISTLTQENGKCVYKIIDDAELEALLKSHLAEVEKKKAEELAKEKAMQKPTK